MNLHRRDFLCASGAFGLAAGLPFPAFAAIDPRLASTLDAIAWDVLRESPETLSQLGLDTGAHAAARGKLADRSAAARARTVAGIARHRRMLAAVDRNALQGHDRLVYDSTDYLLRNAAAGTRSRARRAAVGDRSTACTSAGSVARWAVSWPRLHPTSSTRRGARARTIAVTRSRRSVSTARSLYAHGSAPER